MWPSKPLHVAYTNPYLLCFCDRGVDVFNVKTGEWIQILQFSRVNLISLYTRFLWTLIFLLNFCFVILL